jgi:hypothetical protein
MMMMIVPLSVSLLLLLAKFGVSEAFQSINRPAVSTLLPQSSLSSSRQQAARQQQQQQQRPQQQQQRHGLVALSASTDEEKETEKAAPVISGEELEMMMQDWELPLVVDAYATWYVRVFSFFTEYNIVPAKSPGKLWPFTRKPKKYPLSFFVLAC